MPGPVRLSAALALVSLTCLLPSALRAAAPETQAELFARLEAVRQASALRDPALKPWHLTVSFDLLDEKGTVSEKGTLEEWWIAPDRWRSKVTSPSYNAEEIADGTKHYRTKDAKQTPELIRALREQYDNPLPGEAEIRALTLDLVHQKVGGSSYDCLVLKPAHGEDNPAYCISPEANALRFSLRYHGGEEILRNQPGQFQGKAVFLSVTVSGNGKPLLQGKLDVLSTVPPESVSLVPDASLVPVTPPTRLQAGVVAGKKIGGSTPQYPAEAKRARIQGSVMLSAIIDKTGHIRALTPLWSPSRILTDSAVDAVRTWTYQPYLLNGQPVEIETQMVVNYYMGR